MIQEKCVMTPLDSGLLSIESKNIFSILKKWLYTEQDIVFRELISNANDAIEKLTQLQLENPLHTMTRGQIIVTLDSSTHTLTISDNGIGMTYDEVHQYINQIAFSGAKDFISKNNQLGKDTIIGHFGVGFYSAFMLTNYVSIETKSYLVDAPAVHWQCTEDMAYEMSTGTKETVGTDIILHLPEAHPYFAQPKKVLDTIKKYFEYAKTPVYLVAPGFDQVLINTPTPIWKRPFAKIDTDEMNTFYRETFKEDTDPLFWIPIESVDIGLRGMLFFRNTKNGTNELDGTIKVYSRGVYIGENIRDIIPKFINLQHGIIECDHLPLVVSRSTIKGDSSAPDHNMLELIQECLCQEVTIAMNTLFQQHRDQYETYWPEINAFSKYAMMNDKTFASVMSKKIIFKDIYGNYQTVKEYLQIHSLDEPKTVLYASDQLEQAYYIALLKKCQLNALLFDHVIDQALIYKYEVLFPDTKFLRIDSNIDAIFTGDLLPEDTSIISDLETKITTALGDRLGAITLKFVRLKQDCISSLIINDEQSRRLTDMMEIYGYLGLTDFEQKEKCAQSTLLFNLSNPMVQYLVTATNPVIIHLLTNQLFDLALISQQTMKPSDLNDFIVRSELVLSQYLLGKKA